ncbi:restriction endonuclease subunit S [Helicobacter pylori]|uniref:restriction endonuclease subunit S n=1 Tax=Helicobacter pylori TaxID=210 RepID=UPI0019209D89|nr:restriction endonuclease subunit S [Helicobacter pylori]QQW66738.1 restriction endonuclease subunit S [Helicobacter pylori]
MIGPLSSQLNAIKWGEFRLGDLFEIRPTKAYKLTNSHLFDNSAKNPVVTNSSLNNGISGYSSLEPTEKGNQITYSDTTTSEGIFYQKRPFIGYSHVQGLYSLKYHEFWNEKTLLYIVTVFKKVACGRFNYGNKFNRKIASGMPIFLPTNQHGKIDFNFMEKFIAELEQCRLAELEAYLKATGLSNTTLSNDEENALNLFNGKNSGGGNTPCGLTWQSFRLGDLFEIRPTKAYKLTNSHLFDNSAKNPVVTNSSLNNGISGYSSLEPTEKGNQITYSDTTTSEGIFYQKRPFIGYSHVQGLYSLKYHEFWNEKTLLYIVTVFKKVACGRFNYGNKFNRKIASGMPIFLPTNQHGKIDFHFMHTFINALMKQTIQGVVQYSSAKMQATKEAISQETPTQKDSLF